MQLVRDSVGDGVKGGVISPGCRVRGKAKVVVKLVTVVE